MSGDGKQKILWQTSPGYLTRYGMAMTSRDELYCFRLNKALVIQSNLSVMLEWFPNGVQK